MTFQIELVVAGMSFKHVQIIIVTAVFLTVLSQDKYDDDVYFEVTEPRTSNQCSSSFRMHAIVLF